MTITENTNLAATLGYIADGDFDDGLNEIVEACRARTVDIASALTIEDRVTTQNISPKYMMGLRGKITGKYVKAGKVVFTVEIDESSLTRQVRESKYLTAGCITGPATLFRKID